MRPEEERLQSVPVSTGAASLPRRANASQNRAKTRSCRKRAATLRRIGWRRLRGGRLTPSRAAASVALGLFVGCLPLYGLHLPLCLALCLPLRLDAAVAYLAANISNPLVAPWLLLAEVQIGSLLLTGALSRFDVHAARATGVMGYAAYAAIGSVIVGAVLAGIGGVIAASIAGRSARRRGT